MNSGKNDVTNLEMSRYINLDIYHAVERSHPYYVEMVGELVKDISEAYEGKGGARILEIGAGTGLATEDFAKLEKLEITAIDMDENCKNILHGRNLDGVETLCADATTYCEPNAFDFVVSVFAHDHIHYDSAEKFVANIHKNLKPNGLYLMGGEVLPYYDTLDERTEALYAYHTFIVNKALREENFELAQIEINALKSGLHMIGDFKRHETMFEEEMTLGGNFEMIKKIKLGPDVPDDVGGVFVYVFKAI